MTVTTFSELELDESLLDALQEKGFTRPTAIRPPPFRLRLMGVMFSVQRRPARVKRRRICCQRCSTCSISRVRNPARRVFSS
jgi:hypothetical protein